MKEICIGVNRMDWDTAGYKQEHNDAISHEMKSTLIKVGWKKEFIEKNTPVLPISGWMKSKLFKKSEKMAWWKGTKVLVDAEESHVDTLYDVLSLGICKIKGVGDVLAGRVEQGIVKPGEEAIFLPTHTGSSSQWKRTISSMAIRLGKKLTNVRENGDLWWLRLDGKTEVMIEYVQRADGCVKLRTIIILHGDKSMTVKRQGAEALSHGVLPPLGVLLLQRM